MSSKVFFLPPFPSPPALWSFWSTGSPGLVLGVGCIGWSPWRLLGPMDHLIGRRSMNPVLHMYLDTALWPYIVLTKWFWVGSQPFWLEGPQSLHWSFWPLLSSNLKLFKKNLAILAGEKKLDKIVTAFVLCSSPQEFSEFCRLDLHCTIGGFTTCTWNFWSSSFRY